MVAAGADLAYALRRPVDPMQLAYRDPVTLTATARSTGEPDSVTATNLLAAPTHAMLARFEIGAAGGQAVVEWQTSLEHRTAGFVVSRRTANGALERLHRGLLPAFATAPVGGAYRFVDATAVHGETYTYVLQELEIDGAARLLGRVEATVDTSVDSVPPISEAFSRQLRPPFSPRQVVAAGASAAADERKAAGATGRLKLLVQQAGLVFASTQSLADAFGLPISQIEDWIVTGRLRLHQGAGTETEIVPCPQTPFLLGEIFSDGFESGDLCAWRRAIGSQVGEAVAWLAAPEAAGIYFYGEAIDSIYTDDNVYWLEHGAGMRMATLDGGDPDPVPGLAFTEVVHFEEEGPLPLTSVIEDPDSDFWFWDFVNVTPSAGVAIDTMSVSVATPGRTSATIDAAMSVHLQAESSDDTIDPDHQVEVRLNGAMIGAGSWDGATAHRLDLTFSQALLNDGDNTLEIHAPAASGIASEIFYLDAIDVTYERRYRAVAERLEADAGGHSVVTIEGFTEPEVVVFDVSKPAAPSVVDNLRIEASGDFAVSFETGSPQGRYLAQPLAAAAVPTLVVDQPSDLLATSNRADYLVIAAAGLEDAAEELAGYRRSQGLEAEMVRLEDIYDEFHQGVVSPWAIQDFLRAAAAWQRPPRYVVLAGDSSFDYKDRLGFGGNLLPAPMASTPEGLFPSDHRIADLSGADGVPEVAIGRLPVRENAELAAYLAKLSAYEAAVGSWKSRTVWVADAADEGGEFASDSDWLIERVPQTLDVERAFVDEVGAGTVRQQLLEAIDSGSLLLHFLGHGNLMQMGDDAGLLLASDVPSLNNGSRLPVLTAMTCALGRFDRIFFDTLSESLVLRGDGGVIALWAPTGFSFNEEAVLLSDAFVPSVLGDGAGSGERLGDAIARALTHYLATAEEPREFIPYVYTLLGDPAVRLAP